MATRCRMPPDSSCGYLSASIATFSPTCSIHWRPSSLALPAPHAAALQAEGDVLQHACDGRSWCSPGRPCRGRRRGRRPARSARGPRRWWADAAAAGPAISRRMVLLPQPLGPRTQMNSPLSGRSSTKKVTSRMAVYSFGRPGVVGLRHACGTRRRGAGRIPWGAEAIDDLTHADGRGRRQAVFDFGCRGLAHGFHFGVLAVSVPRSHAPRARPRGPAAQN